MSQTATLLFTGICYLVVSPPANQPSELRAVVANLSDDIVGSSGRAIPEHVPFIAANFDAIDTTPMNDTRDPDIVVCQLGVKTAIWFLNGEAVSIEGVLNSALDVPAMPTDPNRLSFATFVPHVANICPTCVQMTDAALANPNPTRVGGIVDLKVGVVTVPTIAVNKNCIWRFAPENGHGAPPDSVLAQQVAVDFDVKDQFLLRIGHFGGGQTRAIRFLKNPTHIDVVIGSGPLQDIENVFAPTMHDVDYHFELYYLLLEGSNSAGHPLPNAVDPSACFRHMLGGANCPPLQQP